MSYPWTSFPVAFGAIFETLAVPLFLAALGIILRGTAFALRGQAATIGEARVLGACFALSSVVLPFFLGTALGGVVSGRVDAQDPSASADAWLNATSIAIGILAVVTGASSGIGACFARPRRGCSRSRRIPSTWAQISD